MKCQMASYISPPKHDRTPWQRATTYTVAIVIVNERKHNDRSALSRHLIYTGLPDVLGNIPLIRRLGRCFSPNPLFFRRTPKFKLDRLGDMETKRNFGRGWRYL